jgi:hypothetical protein
MPGMARVTASLIHVPLLVESMPARASPVPAIKALVGSRPIERSVGIA